jgi:transposase
MPRKATTPARKASRTRKPGRPPSITQEVQDQLCAYLQLGAPDEDACRAAGVSARTYYRWRAAGEEHQLAHQAAEDAGTTPPKLGATEERYRQFWQATERARGRKTTGYLQSIAAAAAGGATFTEVRREIEHVRVPDATKPEGYRLEARVVKETRNEVTLRPDWRAAAWALERTDSAFARREHVELTGRDGGPLESKVNVGDAAVHQPVVADAVDLLLEAAVGHSRTTDGPDQPGTG